MKLHTIHITDTFNFIFYLRLSISHTRTHTFIFINIYTRNDNKKTQLQWLSFSLAHTNDQRFLWCRIHKQLYLCIRFNSSFFLFYFYFLDFFQLKKKSLYLQLMPPDILLYAKWKENSFHVLDTNMNVHLTFQNSRWINRLATNSK